jgi:hypothetical protein
MQCGTNGKYGSPNSPRVSQFEPLSAAFSLDHSTQIIPADEPIPTLNFLNYGNIKVSEFPELS